MSDRQAWHLEKSVSLSHILSTIGLFVMLAGGWNTITSRLAVLESQQQEFNERIISVIEAQAKTDTRQDAELAEIRRQTREDYKEILNRLDDLRGPRP